MKRLYLILLLIVTGNSMQAQPLGRVDTIYYDKNWKGVPNALFADFYRVVFYPADSTRTKLFRDFYITGELQASGSVLKLDPMDDSNTIFDGECINYTKNQVATFVRSYRDGVLDGKFSEYDETGRLIKEGFYARGILIGKFVEYLNDNRRVQVEYVNGKPVGNKYAVIDSDGNSVDYDFTTHKPIWESPSLSEKRYEYRDGVVWQYYSKNSLFIALANTTVRDYGKWHRLDVVISNNSLEPIDFTPEVAISAFSVDKNEKITNLSVWSAEAYLKKVKRSNNWSVALMALAEGISTANAGYSSSITNTYHSGTTYGSNDYAYGSYSGTSTSTTRTYNVGVAQIARMASQQRVENYGNALSEEKRVKELGYLKHTVIYPGETISGYVHIQRVRGERVTFIVSIEGARYGFEWNY